LEAAPGDDVEAASSVRSTSNIQLDADGRLSTIPISAMTIRSGKAKIPMPQFR
jgi:hypothetical protein